MNRHALIIYNPAAGTAVDPDLWLGMVVHRLCDRYTVTVLTTKRGMRPEDVFLAISDPLDLIVAAGGDGTIRFALAAVAAHRSDVPVGIIPLGTGNQLARNLHVYEENILSDPLEESMSVLMSGVAQRIDLGIMNGEYFCVAAGCGPISDAIITSDRQDKANWKMLAYASSMIQTLALPPVIFKIEIPGEDPFTVTASGVFITNIADLGVGTLSESAQVNDGLLDLVILNPAEFQDYLELGFRFAGGFVGGKAPYYIRKVSKLDIEVVPVRSKLSRFQHLGHRIRSFLQGVPSTRPPVKREVLAAIDGDAYGTTPMHIEVAPLAANVLVPSRAVPLLFIHKHEPKQPEAT
ncbi:MAG TPA: diacylglycerol kinase family protein [Planktothrix sp.]|jgi:diacylglycerol kinase family enzyme